MPFDPATIARWRQDLVFSEVLGERRFQFRSTWGLFSPEHIDDGSRLLLDYLDVAPADDCLDLGCGWGVLGIVLASRAPRGKTLMVDKDFVAVEYAKKNVALNHLDNCQTILSNGFASVGDRRFHHIVSNFPAKASKEQHYLFLVDAFEHLRPGGQFTVVTISGLREFIARTFNEVFGNYRKLKQGKTYTVAQAVK